MAEQITYIQSFAVNAGPLRSATATISAEAYDIITVTVPKSASIVVAMQPGGIASLKGVLITANRYTSMTYVIDSGSPITLDAPQMFLGAGQCALFGATFGDITFTNGSSTDAVIVSMIILRTAIEP
jgi:Ni,Fe-hydrogenase III small subunit